MPNADGFEVMLSAGSINGLARKAVVIAAYFFFRHGALFRGLGDPPVFEKPARYCPRPGRGFIRPPICPMSPSICSPYGGASGRSPLKLLPSDE